METEIVAVIVTYCISRFQVVRDSVDEEVSDAFIASKVSILHRDRLTNIKVSSLALDPASTAQGHGQRHFFGPSQDS